MNSINQWVKGRLQRNEVTRDLVRKRKTMRKIVFLALLSGVILGSCEKNGNGCQPEKNIYSYLSNKKIDTTRVVTSDPGEFYTYTFSAGTKNLFKWNYFFADCPQIADDEGSRNIYFEAPMGTDHFVITDSAELRAAKCLVFLSCECSPSLPLMIKSGKIEGTKISNGWKVAFDVQMPWSNGARLTTEQVFLEEK